MSDMPERIWAWGDKPPYDKHSGGWVYQDNGLDAVEYVRADLAVDAMTLERAAKAAWDAIWPGGQPYGPTDEALMDAAVAADAAIRALAPEPAEVTAARVPEPDAELFDRADWYWRELDPDDCGDTPYEAIQRGMIGDFCVCKIASSFTGPVRYGFSAPVLDPESDDNEFLHFRTEQEAIDAAKERRDALRAIAEARHD